MPRDDVRQRLLEAGPDDYVFPDYDGYCFHRVVPTLLRALGGRAPDLTLPDDVFPGGAPDGADFDRVLLLFVDGLGEGSWRAHADDPLLSAFESAGRITPLTSIYPSETGAAVTSHHTGLPAAGHGAIGWDQWVDPPGEVVQTLPFTAGDRPADEAGVTPADLFAGEPLYPDAGVDSVLVQPDGSVDTTYTRRAARGMARRGYSGLDDLAATARDALESADGPTLVDAYLPHVDAVAHAEGTASAAFGEEVGRVSGAVRDLLEGLDDGTGERTLVALTADHGLLDTTPETTVDLRDLDGVWERLRTRDGETVPPVGSARNLHLFVEPGQERAVRAAIEEQVDCLTYTRREAIAEGLFGPDPGERIRERAGDLVVVPREAAVWHDPAKLAYVGMHGGLSADEVLVPFAVARASDLSERLARRGG